MKNIFFILILSLLGTSCNKIHFFDEYQITIPSEYDIQTDEFGENVMFSLHASKKIQFIFQNDISILRKTLFSPSKKEDLLLSMHKVKFRSYIESLNGYNISEVTEEKINGWEVTRQLFYLKEQEAELCTQLRILRLNEKFYPIYSMGIEEECERINEAVENLLSTIEKKAE